MLTVLVFILWLLSINYTYHVKKELARAIDIIDKVQDAMLEALAEDAEYDYQERIDKMFKFITEELDDV